MAIYFLKKLFKSRDLRDLRCMAIYFLKKLFQSWDLRDFIFISLDVTKKPEHFLGPSRRYMHGYLFLTKLFESPARDLRDLPDFMSISLDFTKTL